MIPLYKTSQLYANYDEAAVAVDDVLTITSTRIIVLVDDNPRHHHINFNIRPNGQLHLGCGRCRAQLVERVRRAQGLATEEAARMYIVAHGGRNYFKNNQQGRTIHEDVQTAHRNDHTLGPMNDMAFMERAGDQLADSLNAVHNDDRSGVITNAAARLENFAMRVSEIDQAVAKVNEVGREGQIDVVNTVGHGFTNGFQLGNTCKRPGVALGAGNMRVADFVAQIADSLSNDVRWVLYACSTAGDTNGVNNPYTVCQHQANAHHDPTTCGDLDHQPVAVHLLRELHNHGKTRAEVWGHIRAGNAMTKPHWVCLRMEGGNVVVRSLLDQYREQVGAIGFGARYRNALLRYFRNIGYNGNNGYPDDSHAIWYIPHWPVSFEHVDFSEAPAGAMILNAHWDAAQYSNNAYLCRRDGNNLSINLQLTVINARDHNIQVIPALTTQSSADHRELWVTEPIESNGVVTKTITVTFPCDLAQSNVGVLRVWIKLWAHGGVLVDQFVDEELDPTSDSDTQEDPLSAYVFWM